MRINRDRLLSIILDEAKKIKKSEADAKSRAITGIVNKYDKNSNKTVDWDEMADLMGDVMTGKMTSARARTTQGKSKKETKVEMKISQKELRGILDEAMMSLIQEKRAMREEYGKDFLSSTHPDGQGEERDPELDFTGETLDLDEDSGSEEGSHYRKNRRADRQHLRDLEKDMRYDREHIKSESGRYALRRAIISILSEDLKG